jgi:RimJ/RimL family protein N-acetyltransferase
MSGTLILETERLRLREIVESDAPFILELLNDPAFVANIGDKGVRTVDDAVAYIQNGPRASYEANGFGLFTVELRGSETAIGMCGLVRRDTLPHVDIGYAFLPQHCGQGYAVEAARATLEYGQREFLLDPILAIVSVGNDASMRLLNKIGLQHTGLNKLADDAPYVALFSTASSGLHNGEVVTAPA